MRVLRDRVARLETAGKANADLAQAKKILAEGPQRVLSQEKGSNYAWDQRKDRSLADQVRYEVLDLLERL